MAIAIIAGSNPNPQATAEAMVAPDGGDASGNERTSPSKSTMPEATRTASEKKSMKKAPASENQAEAK